MKRANRLAYLVTAFAPLVFCGCAGIAPPTASLKDYGPLAEARSRPLPVSLLGRRLEPLGRDVPPAYIDNLDAAWAAFRENRSDVDRLIWVARRLGYLRRMNEAIALLSEGLRVHPNHAGLLRHRGHRYLSVRRFDDARADLERAAELIRADLNRGRSDIVEQDGLPNARNIPLTTLGFNVWYHLGLARYLTGGYAESVAAFEEAARLSRGFDDNRAATTYWVYLATRRQGRETEARRLLDGITPDMDIIENHAYQRLVLIFREGTARHEVGAHAGAADETAAAEKTLGALDRATIGYGIGCLHLFTGDKSAARAAFERVVRGDEWPAFGFIAAEAELAREMYPSGN